VEEAAGTRGILPSLRYRRAVVRDLAWLVLDGALPLPAAIPAPTAVTLDAVEKAEFIDLLQRWDEDPQDTWLGPVDPRLRLGLYTERLIGAWLRQSERIRLMAMNWPLRVERITLGEADFLVHRRGGGLQLWELACKFYLGVPGRGWIGPGLNDSLAAKLARVQDHQLQLIHQPRFRAEWEGDWSAQAWLTGWLLAPAGPVKGGRLDALPTAGARIPSVWAQAGDVSVALAEAQAEAAGVSQWWLLPKRRWLRPVCADEPVEQGFATLAEAAGYLAGQAALQDPGAGHPRPLMLAGISWRVAEASPGAPAIASEVMRLMLVPAGWLQRAAGLSSDRAAREGGMDAAGALVRA
jgi:hypothetical protein